MQVSLTDWMLTILSFSSFAMYTVLKKEVDELTAAAATWLVVLIFVSFYSRLFNSCTLVCKKLKFIIGGLFHCFNIYKRSLASCVSGRVE